MLYRKAYEKLKNWKTAQDKKKALCILGARQIGKTTTIRQFAKENYKHVIEINFILSPKAIDIFDGDLDIKTILTNLSAYIRKPLPPGGDTLIFLDEIQECPNVRTAIKALVEDGRYDYIESGSLLGIKYKQTKSLPVGFEEIYYMYPIDFEEFLIANGVQKNVFEYLNNCYKTKTPVTKVIHETIINLFYTYLVVGGMPQAVNTYVTTNDIGKVINIQKDILELYRQDISKYSNKTDTAKIKEIFDAIPSELNDKNRRFILSSLNENARHLRYQDSFNWLNDAGVALPCFNVSEPKIPLSINEKRNLFKLYMGDIGLLCAATMENIQFDLLQGNVDINMGSILENAFAEQLKANGFNLHYFDSKRYGEIDFVLQRGTKIDLLEIKSGDNYKKHTALNNIQKVENWNFDNIYIFNKGNIETKGNITYLPWYMVIFYKAQENIESYIHKVDMKALDINFE